MTFYIQACVKDGNIFTVRSQVEPIAGLSVKDPMDFAINATVDGDYMLAGEVLSVLSIAGQVLSGLTIASQSVVAPSVTYTPAALLAAERNRMVCSRLQGRLVLGATTCAQLDAMTADPLTPWPMRQAIAHAIEWRRMSETMTELGYLLGYTDTQMDDLFRLAMTVDV
ncbi:MAG: hypothetical protein ACRCYS_10580 [Beijerinckiaceae bacterium]